jgi:hypothetical protein
MGRLKARNADESCHRLIACHMVDRNWKFIGNNGMRVGMRKELTRVMVADLKSKLFLGMRIPLLYLKIRNGFGGWSNTRGLSGRGKDNSRGQIRRSYSSLGFTISSTTGDC